MKNTTQKYTRNMRVLSAFLSTTANYKYANTFRPSDMFKKSNNINTSGK